MKLESTAPSCLLLILATASVLLTACSENAPEPRDPLAEMATLAREARKHVSQLDGIMKQGALSRDNFTSTLLVRRNALESFVQNAATVGDDAVAAERAIAQGQKAIEALDGPFRRALTVQLAASGVVQRCTILRREIIRYLTVFKVERSTVFGLRDRFQEGWVPENDEWIKDFRTGISEILQGGNNQRAMLAGKNLERSAKSGATLLQSIQVKLQCIETGDRRLSRDIPRLLEYAEKVGARASKALADGKAGPLVTEEAVEKIATLRQKLADQASPVAASWKKLRIALIAGEAGSDAGWVELEKQIYGLRSSLLRATRPIGMTFDIAPPGAEALN